MYLRVSRHIYLHYGLLCTAFLSLFTPVALLYLQMFISALWHEACHLFAALYLHVPIRRIELLPYGCTLRLTRMNFYAETLITAAGPLGSLSAALLFSLCNEKTLAALNFCLLFFNLTPALPLDGGRLLRLILWKKIGFIRGNTCMRRISSFTSVLFLCGAFFGGGLSLVAAASIILSALLTAPPDPSPLLLQKKVHKCDIKVIPVSYNDSLLHLLHHYSPFYYALFYIASEHMLLSEQAVSTHIRTNGICGNISNLPRTLFLPMKL